MSDAGPLYNETLTDALPSVVFVLDAEGIVQLWNRAAETFTGTSREEVIGTAEVSRAFY
jgi:PAS domain S-box-containing protein